MFKRFLYTTILFFVLAPQAKGIELQLQESCTVVGSEISIADLVRSTDAVTKLCNEHDCVVAPAPPPGQTRVISLAEIQAKTKHALADTPLTWSGVSEIAVTRDGIPIDKNTFEQILAEYLQKNMHRLPQAEIRLASLRTPTNFTLPSGNLTWKVTPSDNDILKSSSFAVIFKVNGETVKNCSIKTRFEAFAQAAVANKTLRKGALVTNDDFYMKKIDLVRYNQPFSNISDLAGLQVKRTISNGKVIESDYVMLPPVIQKGEAVKILANRGPLRLSASGIAYSSGYLGDVIRVRNTGSNKLIQCRINAAGLVSVEF